jgi:hypothetical protein
MTAAEILAEIAKLPAAEQRKVWAAQPPRSHPGADARRAQAEKRWRLIKEFVQQKGLSLAGRGALAKAYALLVCERPELMLTKRLPRGATLVSIWTDAPHWVHEHTMTLRSFRQGWWAWRNRKNKDCNSCPSDQKNTL